MSESERAAADAFALLSDETRFAIVEALVDHAFETSGDALSFADLRRTVGVRDAGKFNYHLGKLQPQFVHKRDEGGYAPRFAALEAVGVARGGTFTELPSRRAEELDRSCPMCGDPLTAIHEGSRLVVRCETEDSMLFQNFVPPRTAADRDLEGILDYAIRNTQRQIEELQDGVCIICGGPVDTTVPAEPPGDSHLVTAGFDCTCCPFEMRLPMAVTLNRHPAVVAHRYEHGLDTEPDPLFTTTFTDPEAVTIEDEDPFRARVDLETDAGTVSLEVDETLDARPVTAEK